LNEANNEIENLVGTRTRIMQSKLKNVEQLELPKEPEEERNLLDLKD
jgi:DNA anti-recombination protein RmuC